MSSDTSSLSAQVNRLNISDEQASSETAPSELVAVVDDLLNQLSTKFSNISGELIGKRTAHLISSSNFRLDTDGHAVDEMSRRLDNLEATIAADNAQAGSQGETRMQ